MAARDSCTAANCKYSIYLVGTQARRRTNFVALPKFLDMPTQSYLLDDQVGELPEVQRHVEAERLGPSRREQHKSL